MQYGALYIIGVVDPDPDYRIRFPGPTGFNLGSGIWEERKSTSGSKIQGEPGSLVSEL